MGLLALVLLLAPEMATPPKPEALLAAVKRKDAIEIERVARRIGVGRIERALADERPDIRQAALAAAPYVDGAWSLLEPISERVAAPADELASSALLAARKIAMGLDRGGSEVADIPRDVLTRAEQLLLLVARNRNLPASRRAGAIGVAAILGERAPLGPDDLAELLDDPAAEVRRAVIDTLATLPSATSLLSDRLGREQDADLATAIAASVCARLSHPLPRMRELALEGRALAADAIELLDCLSRGTLQDRMQVAEAAHRHPLGLVRIAAQKRAPKLTGEQTPVPSTKPNAIGSSAATIKR